MVRGRPLNMAFWFLGALLLLTLAVAALTGFLVVAGVVVGLVVLNLVYLPRAAQRLNLAPAVLAVVLLPVLLGGGWLVSGVQGAAWGAGIWILAIGLPRVAVRRLARRIVITARTGSTLEGITCPRCGAVSVPVSGEPFACARCAASRLALGDS
jgi:hypothetical protein